MRLREFQWLSAEGLTLFARDHGPEDSAKTPLLCLSGFTRNCKDFEPLLSWLPLDRRIICPDYRGRGRSAYATDAKTYTPFHEMADQIALLDHLGIERAAVIGTSRGGIIAMLMGAFHKARLAGVLLNDIGPKLDKAGLLRIRNNIDGPAPVIGTWDGAIAYLQSRDPGYETLTGPEWLAMAKRIFAEKDGAPAVDFDVRLVETFPSREAIESDADADLWEPFAALAGLPVTVLRGEHSDLFSAATVSEMQKRLPGLAAATVSDRGHIPLLDEPASKAAIAAWLAAIP
jgi:pimeloyl-ACP methyl ester carboxylesterase